MNLEIKSNYVNIFLKKLRNPPPPRNICQDLILNHFKEQNQRISIKHHHINSSSRTSRQFECNKKKKTIRPVAE